jgi:hypothetical protein
MNSGDPLSLIARLNYAVRLSACPSIQAAVSTTG